MRVSRAHAAGQTRARLMRQAAFAHDVRDVPRTLPRYTPSSPQEDPDALSETILAEDADDRVSSIRGRINLRAVKSLLKKYRDHRDGVLRVLVEADP